MAQGHGPRIDAGSGCQSRGRASVEPSHNFVQVGMGVAKSRSSLRVEPAIRKRLIGRTTFGSPIAGKHLINTAKVIFAGSRPFRIASTMSGASRVSRRTRPARSVPTSTRSHEEGARCARRVLPKGIEALQLCGLTIQQYCDFCRNVVGGEFDRVRRKMGITCSRLNLGMAEEFRRVRKPVCVPFASWPDSCASWINSKGQRHARSVVAIWRFSSNREPAWNGS
jgi:hypothetical protein